MTMPDSYAITVSAAEADVILVALQQSPLRTRPSSRPSKPTRTIELWVELTPDLPTT